MILNSNKVTCIFMTIHCSFGK